MVSDRSRISSTIPPLSRRELPTLFSAYYSWWLLRNSHCSHDRVAPHRDRKSVLRSFTRKTRRAGTALAGAVRHRMRVGPLGKGRYQVGALSATSGWLTPPARDLPPSGPAGALLMHGPVVDATGWGCVGPPGAKRHIYGCILGCILGACQPSVAVFGISHAAIVGRIGRASLLPKHAKQNGSTGTTRKGISSYGPTVASRRGNSETVGFCRQERSLRLAFESGLFTLCANRRTSAQAPVAGDSRHGLCRRDVQVAGARRPVARI